MKPLEHAGLLAWQGRCCDHEGGLPGARVRPCTPDMLSPAGPPTVGPRTQSPWSWGAAFALPPEIKGRKYLYK